MPACRMHNNLLQYWPFYWLGSEPTYALYMTTSIGKKNRMFSLLYRWKPNRGPHVHAPPHFTTLSNVYLRSWNMYISVVVIKLIIASGCTSACVHIEVTIAHTISFAFATQWHMLTKKILHVPSFCSCCFCSYCSSRMCECSRCLMVTCLVYLFERSPASWFWVAV
jgi:hypothetical protein